MLELLEAFRFLWYEIIKVFVKTLLNTNKRKYAHYPLVFSIPQKKVHRNLNGNFLKTFSMLDKFLGAYFDIINH